MEKEEIPGDSSRHNEFKTPKVGMHFPSEFEVRKFYKSYARRVGFDTSKLWNKKGDDGHPKYFAIGCSKYGKAGLKKKRFDTGPSGNTECKARINVKVLNDEVFVISGLHLEHNHDLSPGKSVHFRCNKELTACLQKGRNKLNSSTKRKLEINDQAGIGLSKTFQSFDMMSQNPCGGSVIPIVPSKLRTAFGGKYDEACSVRGFRDSLDCEEIPLRKTLPHQYRVFWYPENATPVSRVTSNSIQQKIKDFLLLLGTCVPNYWIMQDLVQFWAPKTTESGREVLSVTKQPFGVRANFKGLCRYRYYCCSDGRTEVCDDFGPVGRAFTRGSPEFCPNIDVYEEEGFPVKNAKHCGIVGYLALPLFELGQQLAIGVLEFVSFTKHCLSSNDIRICRETLKEVGLAIRYPSHSEAITQIQLYFKFPPLGDDACKGKPDKISYVLDLVRKVYNLPLIQVWLPCICDGSEVSIECEPNSDSFPKATHLVCGLHSLDRDEKQSDMLSWYACCDPQAYFVEDGKSWVGRAYSLKKICFVKDIRKYSIVDYPLVTSGHSFDLLACFAVPLQLVNPMLPPLVLEVFLSTQYDYGTYQGAILKPLLSMVARKLSKYNAEFGSRQDEECFIEISHSYDDYDCGYFDVYHGLPVIEEDYVQPNDTTEIEEIMRPPYTAPCREPLFGRSSLKRKSPRSGERNDAHPVQHTPEFLAKSVDSCDEDQQSRTRHLQSDNLKAKEEEATRILISIPVEIYASANGRGACIEPGNNEVDYGASMGKNTETENEVDHGKARSTVLESVEADHSCTMIVKARYKDDMVKFPFSSNSGIEGLRKHLLKRFELGVQKIKIKYQDGGEWIMLSCSEDLSLHMNTLKSSGHTTLDLSVF